MAYESDLAIHRVTMWVRNYATLSIIMVSQQASPSAALLPSSIEVPFSILQQPNSQALPFLYSPKFLPPFKSPPLKQQQTELEKPNEHEFHDMQAN